MLAIRALRKRYGDLIALDGVDLDVAAGEILALLGPNGAGKTTLVSIVAGLRRADGGTVRIDGADALRHSARTRQSLGLAPQETSVYPTITARANLVLFGELYGLRRAELGDAIERVSEALDLEPLLDRAVRTFSGGEKRRLHTAIALLHRPRLVLLDEPTVGADIRTRSRILVAVRALAAEGTAVVYSTHYLPEVEELDASVAIVDRGRIVGRGTVVELVAAHATPAVEVRFQGAPPDLPALGAERIDNGLRIETDRPGQTAAAALDALGADAARVRSIDIVNPGLDQAFLALTGRRYASEDPTDAP